MKAESELVRSQRSSGCRRSTRSQGAPDWTSTDELLLVNEIAAVEADCLKTLSSYQKWNIISQNCSALGVRRTGDQYRRKWEALSFQYKSIKEWEMLSRPGASYWVLEIERRKQNGLPENFDHELFSAIDKLVRVRDNQSDTDPDSDPEAEDEDEADDVAKLVVVPESKMRRHQLTPQKSCPTENSARSYKVEKPQETKVEEKPQETKVEEKPQETHVEEKPQETHVEEKPQETHAEEKPAGSCSEVIPQNNLAEEKPQKMCVKKKQKNGHTKEEAISIAEQDKNMTIKLHENAELIRAIVTENPDHEAAGAKSTGDLHTDFVRCQGDRVIACLGDIVKTLDQLRHLVQECE